MFEAWMIIVGSLVHNLYPWTDNTWIVGLFAPIDESLWEHFKLGYLAALLFIPIERFVLRKEGNTYAFARVTGIVILNLVVVAIFFTVRPVVPESARLAVDIGSYVVGSLVMGQVVRRWSDLPSTLLRRVGLPAFVVMGIMFAAFTIWKPASIIFVEHAW